jgi:hypothetical protein
MGKIRVIGFHRGTFNERFLVDFDVHMQARRMNLCPKPKFATEYRAAAAQPTPVLDLNVHVIRRHIETRRGIQRGETHGVTDRAEHRCKTSAGYVLLLGAATRLGSFRR